MSRFIRTNCLPVVSLLGVIAGCSGGEDGGGQSTGGAAGTAGKAGVAGGAGVAGTAGGSTVAGSGGTAGAGGGGASMGGTMSMAGAGGGSAGGGGAGGATAMGRANSKICELNPVPMNAGSFKVTTPTLMDCAAIPATHTCEGANKSPEFSWSGAPAGTKSYAMVLDDLVNGHAHYGIWNIPATATGLPAAIADNGPNPSNVPGATQAAFWAEVGFKGSCPNPPDRAANALETHEYRYTVYALSVADLAFTPTKVGSGDEQVMMQALRAKLAQNALAIFDIRGLSKAQRPAMP